MGHRVPFSSSSSTACRAARSRSEAARSFPTPCPPVRLVQLAPPASSLPLHEEVIQGRTASPDTPWSPFSAVTTQAAHRIPGTPDRSDTPHPEGQHLRQVGASPHPNNAPRSGMLPAFLTVPAVETSPVYHCSPVRTDLFTGVYRIVSSPRIESHLESSAHDGSPTPG